MQLSMCFDGNDDSRFIADSLSALVGSSLETFGQLICRFAARQTELWILCLFPLVGSS